MMIHALLLNTILLNLFLLGPLGLITFSNGSIIGPPEKTKLENDLETEIELTAPSSFPIWNTMSVRLDGFKYMTRHYEDGRTETYDIGNWENWARAYWYETRIPNTTCPQLPQGIAAACDLAAMVPCFYASSQILLPAEERQSKDWPRTIFVHTLQLPHFVESTLRFIENIVTKDHKFVIVVAGYDATTPQSSLDSRYKALRGFGGGGGQFWNELLSNAHVAHVFLENHDMEHEKLSTLPSGIVSLGKSPEYGNVLMNLPDDRRDFPPRDHIRSMLDRPLSVLVSDRVRSGTGQWQERGEVVQMCEQNKEWCVRPAGFDNENGVSRDQFLRNLAEVPFVACPHGGGIDPSPKAWEALLLGTIPIIKRGHIDDAYSKFPVVFVDSWDDLFKAEKPQELLEAWRKQLAPFFEEDSELRAKTLERLSISYWLDVFDQRLEEYKKKTS